MGCLVDQEGPGTRIEGGSQIFLVLSAHIDISSVSKLLMPRDAGKRREKPEEDIALLEQIQEANPAAGTQYLEYLVLQRRTTVRSVGSIRVALIKCPICQSRELHMRLALSCVDQVLSFLKDESVAKLWRAKGDYRLNL